MYAVADVVAVNVEAGRSGVAVLVVVFVLAIVVKFVNARLAVAAIVAMIMPNTSCRFMLSRDEK